MKEKVSTVMGVVMPLMLAVLLVMNIFTLVKVNDVQSFINKENGDGDVAQENDVTIGDQYVIKDTTRYRSFCATCIRCCSSLSAG